MNPASSSLGNCKVRGNTSIVVALANRMARMIWALTVRGEVYRKPALAALISHQGPAPRGVLAGQRDGKGSSRRDGIA